MLAAVFQGMGEIEVVELPMPQAGPGEVVVRVGYCGICGSDLEAFQTGMYEPGLIIGHEFAGTITEVGPDVTGWHAGDRVIASDAIPCGACAFCRRGQLDACDDLTMIGVSHDGAMAEYARITAKGLYRLPAGTTLRQGAMVEPLSVALQGVRQSGLQAGDRVLIMGAGPIGLLTLQCALLGGARMVAVSEVDPIRAEAAARLGATAVLNPTRDNIGVRVCNLTDGLGPDLILVCTGAPGPIEDAISLARKGSTIFLLGLCVQPVPADFMSVVLKNLRIEGFLAGRAAVPAALDFVSQRRVDVEALVSHEIRLDEVVSQGFERLASPHSGAIKILVRIGGES